MQYFGELSNCIEKTESSVNITIEVFLFEQFDFRTFSSEDFSQIVYNA